MQLAAQLAAVCAVCKTARTAGHEQVSLSHNASAHWNDVWPSYEPLPEWMSNTNKSKANHSYQHMLKAPLRPDASAQRHYTGLFIPDAEIS